MVEWWLAWFTTLTAAGLGWFWHWHVVRTNRASGVKSAEDLVEEAKRVSEVIRREARAEAREIVHSSREALETERRTARDQVDAHEDKLDRRLIHLEEREQSLDRREIRIDELQDTLTVQQQKLKALVDDRNRELEQLSKLSLSEAKDQLLADAKALIQVESAALTRHLQTEARMTAQEDAQKIVTLAIERYAGETVKQVTTSTVALPSDEMKGRIIGKEGRNIRSLETVTGVNILVDDTPGVVVLSCFDPFRREIARRALTSLIEDGRIHPSSIESTVGETRDQMEEEILKRAGAAIQELSLRNVDPGLLPVLGRLRYRQSYSQNVLEHSIETAQLMSNMAGELGLDTELAKRIGLFHDIGKALTHEVSGPHAIIGGELLKKHGEDQIVVNAVASHHREVEQESAYAHLISAADAMTSARPGARQDSTAAFIKRLEGLEEIALRHQGVDHCYAIQAGRELRVFVKPDEITDDQAQHLAHQITQEVESSLNFPGVITVTVVRETRCTEYAK